MAESLFLVLATLNYFSPLEETGLCELALVQLSLQPFLVWETMGYVCSFSVIRSSPLWIKSLTTRQEICTRDSTNLYKAKLHQSYIKSYITAGLRAKLQQYYSNSRVKIQINDLWFFGLEKKILHIVKFWHWTYYIQVFKNWNMFLFYMYLKLSIVLAFQSPADARSENW